MDTHTHRKTVIDRKSFSHMNYSTDLIRNNSNNKKDFFSISFWGFSFNLHTSLLNEEKLAKT